MKSCWRVCRAAAPRHVRPRQATSIIGRCAFQWRRQLPCYCCISALAPGRSYGHCIHSPEPVFPQRKWSGGPHVARAAHGARGGSALSVTPGPSASASVEWFLFTFLAVPEHRRVRWLSPGPQQGVSRTAFLSHSSKGKSTPSSFRLRGAARAPVSGSRPPSYPAGPGASHAAISLVLSSAFRSCLTPACRAACTWPSLSRGCVGNRKDRCWSAGTCVGRVCAGRSQSSARCSIGQGRSRAVD